jgi:hypothetical protein
LNDNFIRNYPEEDSVEWAAGDEEYVHFTNEFQMQMNSVSVRWEEINELNVINEVVFRTSLTRDASNHIIPFR